MNKSLIPLQVFVDKGYHGIELIHTRPVILFKQGVFCSMCTVDLPYGIQCYSYEGQHYCKSCIHFNHERHMDVCDVCNPMEVNNMETMICPDGTIVISDDVVADIEMMRRIQETQN